MNKMELIEQVNSRIGLTKAEATAVVDAFFESMKEALQNGDRVEIRGFCSFRVKDYKSFTGRNPVTGEKVYVAPKKLPFFKAGKELRERVMNAP